MEHIEVFKQFYKFGKLKGWTEIAPAFKTQPVKREPLSVSEANHIWDHLNLRYDQLQLTDFFSDFVHDPDFSLILNLGGGLLKDEIKTLENLADEYQIPLPKRPPAIMEAPIDPEVMEDEFTFRLLVGSIQNAVDLHTRAVVETIRNDKLREIFFKFLLDEYNILDRIFTYGNLKGWLHIMPSYRIKS